METFNAKIQIRMSSEDDFNAAIAAAEKGVGDSLRGLCRKEVERFELYLKKSDAWFSEGLAPFERLAIEGYLYQKLRGHMDALPVKGLPG
jgi:hypothetical protein